MKTIDYLTILKNEIHSAVCATIGENGRPCTRVIDIMLADETGIYFITAKGKAFYHQLMAQKYVSISAMTNGKDSLSKKSITVQGKIKSIGQSRLDEVFRENLYMEKIYPTEKSRAALEVFWLYEGEGEFFDLSSVPIFRDTFSIGNGKASPKGYFVTNKCRGCKICYANCPQKCIDISVKPVMIHQENCLHCGNCYDVCPFGAVERRL